MNVDFEPIVPMAAIWHISAT